jgi:hypothetical protein
MKKSIGIAAFVLIFSIPAHGQGVRGGVGMSTQGALTNSGGGGGGFGGGLSASSGGRLSSTPPAHLAMKEVTGGDPSYVPSTFLTFEQAVAEGNAESVREKTVAEAAAENNAARKARARLAFEQDNGGRVVSVSQK